MLDCRKWSQNNVKMSLKSVFYYHFKGPMCLGGYKMEQNIHMLVIFVFSFTSNSKMTKKGGYILLNNVSRVAQNVDLLGAS